VLALTRLGIVTPRQLAKNRGYVLLLIAVVAAIATPTPDPVTMLVAMAPMVVLFEGSVLLARIFRPETRAQEVVGSVP
jgi:sec-independent protein translocase protein TatC